MTVDLMQVLYANDAQAVKFRKSQRGKMKGNATRGNTVAFGEYGLQTKKAAWISAREIEAGRVARRTILRREGRLFIRIFPHKPISGSRSRTRMGKGKGEPEYWVAVVKPGTVMFEVAGCDEPTAGAAWRAWRTRCRSRAGSWRA
jgi:large subunit ribosomal protein L16